MLCLLCGKLLQYHYPYCKCLHGKHLRHAIWLKLRVRLVKITVRMGGSLVNITGKLG